MKKIGSFKVNLIWKLIFVAVISLLMLIPINMIKSQIFEREYVVKESISEIESIWGNRQIVCGPYLRFNYTITTKETDGKEIVETKQQIVYPSDLSFDVSAKTQDLHRSIYDVTVYTASMHISGNFEIPTELQTVAHANVVIKLEDLRGIVGMTKIQYDGIDYEFEAGNGDSNITTKVPIDAQKVAKGELIPFAMDLKLKGSEELKFRPIGNVTTVTMRADCSTPSFDGDFLPDERQIDSDMFTAKWEISQINRGEPESKLFGVKLLQPVTQYHQTDRSLKYAILIILLVFMAGLLVEFIAKTEINLVQYVVIGLSLVLFYSLLLAFSEFMAYGLSYLIATCMTVLALTAYFYAILKNKSAIILGSLVLFAYGISYMLLQMETYAFLCGTLILFVVLCVLMFFTRNINKHEATILDTNEENNNINQNFEK